MAIGDCFGLDEVEYAKRMKLCSIEELRKRERQKTRQLYSSSFSMGGAVYAAVHTAGLSLIVGLICCRRASIARQKREIVQKELVEIRRQAKYEPQKEDCCIPFGIFTCGLCVDWGVHTLVAETVIQVPVPPCVPTGESAIPTMFEHPDQATEGFTHAFQNQGAELYHAATVQSTSATESYVQLPASVPSSAGGQVGYDTGMRWAPSADAAGASVVATQIAEFAEDKVEKKIRSRSSVRGAS